MTTVGEFLDKFNSAYRYFGEIEKVNIGNYSFDEAYLDRTGFVMEFLSKKNPDVWLRVNDDKLSINLIKKISDDTVNVTTWIYGKKINKNAPLERFKPYPKDQRKPFLTMQE